MLNSSRQLFGYTKDDLAVETLTLDNGILSCDIITFGAALRSLRVPDRSGIKRDVVLGYDTLEEYESHPGYLGAVVGRVFPWWVQSFLKGIATQGRLFRMAAGRLYR
ncbi:hypothetical protein [Flintibacter muris]|uniref:aldose epimerase family protein n=1 Tax=Flintibacter muris TaxID=2941327 RepID=UPI00203CFD76|nr:hypothetical protein [Flintibacter muris]